MNTERITICIPRDLAQEVTARRQDHARRTGEGVSKSSTVAALIRAGLDATTKDGSK